MCVCVYKHLCVCVYINICVCVRQCVYNSIRYYARQSTLPNTLLQLLFIEWLAFCQASLCRWTLLRKQRHGIDSDIGSCPRWACVYVDVCGCVCVCVCVWMYVCVYVCMCVCVYVCVCVCIHVCVCGWGNVCVSVWVCECVCIFMCVCVCDYLCIYALTCKWIYRTRSPFYSISPSSHTTLMFFPLDSAVVLYNKQLLPGGGLTGVARLVGSHYEIISIIYRLDLS